MPEVDGGASSPGADDEDACCCCCLSSGVEMEMSSMGKSGVEAEEDGGEEETSSGWTGSSAIVMEFLCAVACVSVCRSWMVP